MCVLVRACVCVWGEVWGCTSLAHIVENDPGMAGIKTYLANANTLLRVASIADFVVILKYTHAYCRCLNIHLVFCDNGLGLLE